MIMTSCPSLPAWALKTIDEHKNDDRPTVYTLEQMANAETHDELWNAAQRQLIREGVIHNYVRMLWGKKVHEWSANAEEAIQNLIELNNRYAIDGRNPNSYSGIFWITGRFDRAWGPVRPIFENFVTWPVVPHKRNLKQQVTNVALQRIHSA